MQRTLFFIPHSVLGVPVFGVGWALGLLVLGFVLWLLFVARRREHGVAAELRNHALFWVVAAAAIVFLVPQLEIPAYSGEPLGIPVRGYGVFLLAGVAAGLGLAVVRAERVGIPADAIFGLAFWMFVGGIGGARLFYIIQYRDDFVGDNLADTVGRLLNFTGGGLVVYGSIIGGTIAMVGFCLRHRIETLKMGDVVIPCLFLGIFFGRIGCLMNGCCYGGRCQEVPTALHFPPGSPVYMDQMRSGTLLGLTIEPDAKPRGMTAESGDDIAAGRIVEVEPHSPAARRGIRPGRHVSRIAMVPPPEEKVNPRTAREDMSGVSWMAVVDGEAFVWDADELPRRALAVRPAQILSSFDGLWICAVLLLISRFARLRTGMLMAIGFLIYGFVRFGEEMVRSDESGQFGTQLSISQWVSLAVIPAAIALMAYIYWSAPGGRIRETSRNSGTGAST